MLTHVIYNDTIVNMIVNDIIGDMMKDILEACDASEEREKSGTDKVRVLVDMSRELRYKLKCIAPIYGHSLSSLANALLKKFVADYEARLGKNNNI